jgi:hypothetical protein
MPSPSSSHERRRFARFDDTAVDRVNRHAVDHVDHVGRRPNRIDPGEPSSTPVNPSSRRLACPPSVFGADGRTRHLPFGALGNLGIGVGFGASASFHLFHGTARRRVCRSGCRPRSCRSIRVNGKWL